jgi:hypothetical protein
MRLRRIAVVTALCFGCATARPPTVMPLPLAGAPPVRVALAEPTLELWMEGTRAPSEQESSEALARSRTALARELEGRGGFEDGRVAEPDALLAIHARAVARTSERRQAQIWSVVGVVAVVAIVVAAIVLTRDGGKARRGGAFPVGRVGPAPSPWRGTRYAPAAPSPFFFGWAVGLNVAVPLGPSGPSSLPAEGWPPPEAGAALEPGPDPLLDPRGWLDGDEVELVAELVDPRSSEVRWRRALREGADPRDERAMAALVDRLLAGEPFGQRQAGQRPVAPPAPEPPPNAPEGGRDGGP